MSIDGRFHVEVDMDLIQVTSFLLNLPVEGYPYVVHIVGKGEGIYYITAFSPMRSHILPIEMYRKQWDGAKYLALLISIAATKARALGVRITLPLPLS